MSFWHKNHLVCWLLKKSAGTPLTASATWEDINRSPTFQLEDELLVNRGGDVMWMRQYNCRSRARHAARAASKGVQQPKEAQAAVMNAISMLGKEITVNEKLESLMGRERRR